MNFDRHKRNRKSIRLKNYDYRSNGYYFVTICTHQKICYFGNIKNNQMVLSELGKIAEKYWLEIPQHFGFVKIDRFIIMPNHVHGIIIINNTKSELQKNHQVNDIEKEKIGNKQSILMSNISPKKDSLSVTIRSYKSAVTKWSNKNYTDNFKWQSRFYEHIIRNEESLNNIREYIVYNPANWENDENNIRSNI